MLGELAAEVRHGDQNGRPEWDDDDGSARLEEARVWNDEEREVAA